IFSFFQAEDGIRDFHVTGVQTCALPILKLELIPLVQCLGHMETPLSLPDYKHLRELPHDSYVLNPLAAGARELVQKMVDDVVTRSEERRVGKEWSEWWHQDD